MVGKMVERMADMMAVQWVFVRVAPSVGWKAHRMVAQSALWKAGRWAGMLAGQWVGMLAA